MKTRQLIINWISDYSQNSSLTTLVVGVSGGIDSALVSTLCAETGIKTVVVSMPIHQHKSELDRAHKHIKWLKDNWDDVIGSAFNK